MSHIAQNACIDAGQYAAVSNVPNGQLFGAVKLKPSNETTIYPAQLEDSPMTSVNPRPFRFKPGGGGVGLYMGSHSALQERNVKCSLPKKVTFGSIGSPPEAFVYVGRKDFGKIKIGMSGNPKQRCKNLGISLLFTVPVTVNAAKLVETFALQNLGAVVGESEWVACSLSDAVEAVCAAWMSASKVTHVNPLIDEAQARRDRIAAFS